MKRRLFNLAAVTSLLLGVACLFMWVRSGYVCDEVFKTSALNRSMIVESAVGVLSLDMPSETPLLEGLPPRPWYWEFFSEDMVGSRWEWRWPRYYTEVLSTHALVRHALLPYWLLSVVTGIPPAIWFWQRRKEKKAACRRGFEVLPKPAAQAAP